MQQTQPPRQQQAPPSRPALQQPSSRPAPIPPDATAIYNTIGVADARPLIEAIEQKRGSRVLSLMYSRDAPIQGQLSPALIEPLLSTLRTLGHVEKLDLFLCCYGGVAEVPWRVVSLLREYCDELGVIVADMALSGGSHIAIGADDIVMTPASVIGSVDPTRDHALLPKNSDGEPIPTSVQDLKHCIEFIREQLGESYGNQDLAQIISELFKYVNPLAIGALEQAYNLARLITRKVLLTHKVPLDEDQIAKIVSVLSGQYFSHSYLISRAEVETDLKLPLTRPDEELTGIIYALTDHYRAQFRKVTLLSPPNVDELGWVAVLMETVQTRWAVILATKKQDLIVDKWIQVK